MQVVFSGPSPKGLFCALRLLLAAALTGFAAACVAPFPPLPQAENADRIEQILVEAYEEAGGAYIEAIAVSDMALAGLANLSAIEPGLLVSESGETVTLALGPAPFYHFQKPEGGAASRWADAISDALIAAHGRSSRLQQTAPERIYDVYMAGLASVLGESSRYLSSEEFYGYLRADFDGLIELTYVKTGKGLRILSLDHEGHLAAAGMKVDDVITHIDGKATAYRTQFEVYSLLRGPVGSNISFDLLRDGTTPSKIVVQRWQITPRSYELTRVGGIAVYRLPSLNEFAANSLADSIAIVSSQPLMGLLLDLRSESQEVPGAVSTPSVTFGTSKLDWSSLVSYIDRGFMSGPGGSPDAARRLATAFMSDGVIFHQQGRQDSANHVIEAGGNDPSDQLPLIVIVDSTTIGGAEMAAAGLQDAGRALVLGASTAGSGIIRRNVSLYNLGVINLAWAYAYASSGYGIEGRGVMPNVCTTKPGATLDQLLLELRRGEGMVDDAVRTKQIDPNDNEALGAHRLICPGGSDPDDLAYDLAIAILKAPELYARLMGQGG